MLNKIHDWIKGVLIKMGLASELQNIEDHKKIMVDDEQYSLISHWFSVYQSKPDWRHIHKRLPDKTFYDHDMMSLNMGQVAAKKAASLVFNQKAIITVSPKDAKKADEPTSPEDYQTPEKLLVQQTLTDNHFYNNFERYT